MNPDPAREFFLKANPNPRREGCPGKEVLRAIAANKLSETDPARLHLASCSPCFSEFRAFKEALSQKKSFQKQLLPWAAAACLLVASGVGIYITNFNRPQVNEARQSSPVSKTVDLSNYGTLRGGEAKRLDAVSLPSSTVRVTVVLPKLSDPGLYIISVSPDRDSERVLASGAASAAGDDRRRTVTVLLDLRTTRPGSYFLATTHNQDQSSYFYPLQVE